MTATLNGHTVTLPTVGPTEAAELAPTAVAEVSRADQARAYIRERLADGERPTGADVARRYGVSDRRGRDLVREIAPKTAPADRRRPTVKPAPERRPATLPELQPEPSAEPVPVAVSEPLAEPVPEPSAERVAEPVPVVVPEPSAVAGRLTRWATMLAVAAVAVVAAIMSYSHMYEVAAMAGEGWRAWLWPVAVDGMIVAASMVMIDRQRRGASAGALPWCALALGVGISLVANVAAAQPTTVGRLVAAVPPLCFLIACELLARQRRR